MQLKYSHHVTSSADGIDAVQWQEAEGLYSVTSCHNASATGSVSRFPLYFLFSFLMTILLIYCFMYEVFHKQHASTQIICLCSPHCMARTGCSVRLLRCRKWISPACTYRKIQNSVCYVDECHVLIVLLCTGHFWVAVNVKTPANNNMQGMGQDIMMVLKKTMKMKGGQALTCFVVLDR